MEAHGLVRQIRGSVEAARSLPMSASALVNRTELLGLLDRLEEAVTVGGDEASRRDAAQVIADARQERDRMISEAEVLAGARRRADELLDAVSKDCDELRRETDDYVDTKLANLQIALTKTLEALDRGRERLAGRSDLANLGVDPDEDLRIPSDD